LVQGKAFFSAGRREEGWGGFLLGEKGEKGRRPIRPSISTKRGRGRFMVSGKKNPNKQKEGGGEA